jgi:NifU-like N terminal domain
MTMMLRTTALRAFKPIRQLPTLSRLYHEKVIDHYERPRNVGSLPKNDIDVGTGLLVPLISALKPSIILVLTFCDTE